MDFMCWLSLHYAHCARIGRRCLRVMTSNTHSRPSRHFDFDTMCCKIIQYIYGGIYILLAVLVGSTGTEHKWLYNAPMFVCHTHLRVSKVDVVSDGYCAAGSIFLVYLLKNSGSSFRTAANSKKTCLKQFIPQ